MPDKKQLTVADILEILNSLPPETLILYYEPEYSDYRAATTVTIQDVVQSDIYEDSYNDPEKEDTELVKSIILL